MYHLECTQVLLLKGEYVVCQHNDFYYHGDFFNEFMELIDKKYAYISVDNKKVWMGTYGGFDEVRKILGDDVTMNPFDGGYVKTDFGLIYISLCVKKISLMITKQIGSMGIVITDNN